MTHTKPAENPDKLKEKFWKAMADSPYVMLSKDGLPKSAVPMRAQLDKDANSAIWFFNHKNSDFAQLGAVTAAFEAKGHDMFARFHGTLAVETSQERFDQFWNNFVEAWYDGGKDDPDLLFLRMDLGDAEIWDGSMSVFETAKMALGIYTEPDAEEKHVKEVQL